MIKRIDFRFEPIGLCIFLLRGRLVTSQGPENLFWRSSTAYKGRHGGTCLHAVYTVHVFGAIRSRCARRGCFRSIQEAHVSSGNPFVQALRWRGRFERVEESFPAETMVDGLPRVRRALGNQAKKKHKIAIVTAI